MNAPDRNALRKAAISAVGFFGTFFVLSVGYSAYVGLSSVSAWQTLTVGLWTQVKDNFADHESRIASLTASQSKVGERVLWTSASTPVAVSVAPSPEAYLQKYVDLPVWIWQVSLMGEADLPNTSTWNHARWYCSASASSNADTTGFTRLVTNTWQASSGTWAFYSGYEILDVQTPVRCNIWAYHAVQNNTTVNVRPNQIPIAVRIK